MLQPAHARELINTTAQTGYPEGILKYVHLPPVHCQGHMRVPAGLTGGGEWRACEREGRTNLLFILSNLKLSPFVGGRATGRTQIRAQGIFRGRVGGRGRREVEGKQIERGGGRPVNSGTIYSSITFPSLGKAKVPGIARSKEMITDKGEKMRSGK